MSVSIEVIKGEGQLELADESVSVQVQGSISSVEVTLKPCVKMVAATDNDKPDVSWTVTVCLDDVTGDRIFDAIEVGDTLSGEYEGLLVSLSDILEARLSSADKMQRWLEIQLLSQLMNKYKVVATLRVDEELVLDVCFSGRESANSFSCNYVLKEHKEACTISVTKPRSNVEFMSEHRL